MNKLTYGPYSNNADTPFLQEKGYVDPASGEQTRRQLGQPLREIKEFLDDTMPVDSNNKVAQLYVSANDLKYRTTSGGAWTDINLGIPSGGTTGQILQKNSSTNYDTEWADRTLDVLTTAPASANTDGVKVVYLASEPETKYDGYIYLIKE